MSAVPALQCVSELSQFYTFNLVSAARTFTLTATPKKDTTCGNLTINQSGVRAASAGTVEKCWDVIHDKKCDVVAD